MGLLKELARLYCLVHSTHTENKKVAQTTTRTGMVCENVSPHMLVFFATGIGSQVR